MRATGRINNAVGSLALTLSSDYRVFYDVAEAAVIVIAVLHKRETAEFYRERVP